MLKCIALTVALSGLAAVAHANSDVITPISTQPVAIVTVMKAAKTIKREYVFAGPGKNTAIRKSLPPGTDILLTGEERGAWSELWAEEIGIGWMPTANIRKLVNEPR